MQLPNNIELWPKYYRELYEERAGILEFSGNLKRLYAEHLAEQDIRRQALRDGKKEIQ